MRRLLRTLLRTRSNVRVVGVRLACEAASGKATTVGTLAVYRRVALVLAACALLLARPATSPGQSSSSALINEALEKPVALDLNDVLPAAMRAIENKTSVPLRADPAVWDLLPWGDQTTVRATVQNQTLRQALTAITQKLGLTFALGDETVMILPSPALSRLGRRSTVQELQTLDRLAAEPMPPVTGAGNVRAVLTAIDLKLDALKAPFAIEDRLDPDTRNKVLALPRGATMLDALEQIGKQTRGTWYPWGRTVVVVPKETQVRDMLAKTLTVRHNGVDVGQVLEDLRKRAGVAFEIEPGALQRVPADARTLRVVWDNVTVQQALESIRGIAGIDYQVTDRGVTISNPAPPAAAAAGGSNDPVVAMVQLENGMTVFVRQSQVPPDLQAYLAHRMKRNVDELRQMAKAERFPLTQPATNPGN
jgi:hypothetical protein